MCALLGRLKDETRWVLIKLIVSKYETYRDARESGGDGVSVGDSKKKKKKYADGIQNIWKVIWLHWRWSTKEQEDGWGGSGVERKKKVRL